MDKQNHNTLERTLMEASVEELEAIINARKIIGNLEDRFNGRFPVTRTVKRHQRGHDGHKNGGMSEAVKDRIRKSMRKFHAQRKAAKKSAKGATTKKATATVAAG